MLCSKLRVIALGSLHVYGVSNAGEPDHVTGSPALHPVIRHPYEKCMRRSSLVFPLAEISCPSLSVFLVELPETTQLAAVVVAMVASRSLEAVHNGLC